MSEDKAQAVVIKKYKKGGGDAHGGSWKVAYADFVTAMMAFFLLMWLLNMTSPQEKIALSEYFQNYSLFSKGGGSSIGQIQDSPGKGLLEVGRPKKTTPQESQETKRGEKTTSSSPAEITAIDLEDKLKKQVEKNLNQFKNQIMVINDKGNIRIEIVDTEGNSFFTPGGTEMNEGGKKIIQEITPVLKDLNKKLIIEGHTDSVAFKSKQLNNNWALSTQRALTARIELEKNGVEQKQLEVICGFAETRPFVPENPSDPKNRRITIVVDFKEPVTQPPQSLPQKVKTEPVGSSLNPQQYSPSVPAEPPLTGEIP